MIGDRTEPVLERRRIGIHRNEHQPGDALAAYTGHVGAVAQHLGIECLGVGDLHILSVERELPAVKRAGELVDRAEFRKRDSAAAMRAYVIMRLELIVGVSGDDEALGHDVEAHEIADRFEYQPLVFDRLLIRVPFLVFRFVFPCLTLVVQ